MVAYSSLIRRCHAAEQRVAELTHEVSDLRTIANTALERVKELEAEEALTALQEDAE